MTVPCVWKSLRCEIKNLLARGNKINFKLLVSTRGEESCSLLACPSGCKANSDPSDQAAVCICEWGEFLSHHRSFLSIYAAFFCPCRALGVGLYIQSRELQCILTTPLPFKGVQQGAQWGAVLSIRSQSARMKCTVDMHTILLNVICICNTLGECRV